MHSPSAPVFLHALWRTGSTYIWNKLRESDASMCFYEPLHENLADITVEQLDSRRDGENVALHHPEMDKPYFYEYRRLVSDRGVANFKTDFSYQKFYLPQGEQNKDLQTYIQSLIDFAREDGRRAVFGFCRSTLRVAWMRERFLGLHVALLRDPRSQWGSIHQQALDGNHYFIDVLFQIVGTCRDTPLFSALAERFNVPRYEGSATDVYASYNRFCRHVSLEQAYFVFYFVWLASALHGLSRAHIVCDMDLLSDDRRAQRKAAADFARAGIDVDFLDCKTPWRGGVSEMAMRYNAIEEAATSMISGLVDSTLVNRQRLTENLAHVSDEKKARLEWSLRQDDRSKVVLHRDSGLNATCDIPDQFVADLWRSESPAGAGAPARRLLDADAVLWCSRILFMAEPDSQEWILRELDRHAGMTVEDYRNLILRKTLAGGAMAPDVAGFRRFGRSRVTADLVGWCYRILLLRRAESSEVVDQRVRAFRHSTAGSFIQSMMLSPEFKLRNPEFQIKPTVARVLAARVLRHLLPLQ